MAGPHLRLPAGVGFGSRKRERNERRESFDSEPGRLPGMGLNFRAFRGISWASHSRIWGDGSPLRGGQSAGGTAPRRASPQPRPSHRVGRGFCCRSGQSAVGKVEVKPLSPARATIAARNCCTVSRCPSFNTFPRSVSTSVNRWAGLGDGSGSAPVFSCGSICPIAR